MGTLKNITFSGIDTGVSFDMMQELSGLVKGSTTNAPFIEFGLIYDGSIHSPDPCIMSADAIFEIGEEALSHNINVALHLEGPAAATAIKGNDSNLSLMMELFPVIRLDIMHSMYNINDIINFCLDYRDRTIITEQSDANITLPHKLSKCTNHAYLMPNLDKWQPHPYTINCGYSGDITVNNILPVIRDVSSRVPMANPNFWIEVKQGVRNEARRFDMNKAKGIIHLTNTFLIEQSVNNSFV